MQPRLPRGDEKRDAALDLALREVVPGQGAMERADQPDGFITAIRRVPPSDARYEDFPAGIDPRLRAALAPAGHRPALHAPGPRDRARPRRPARRGDDADGVGEDALLQHPRDERRSSRIRATRALYLFPTKALAQDQLAELDRLSQEISRAADVEVGVFTYDGDTPQDARRAIRGRAHVVLTNPDMLHAGVLPHHPKWAKLFENLRYIVIDELHAYRGVFGSHLGERAAAAAARLRALRIVADVHLLVGDDRQPGRAGREPDRAAVRAGRGERRAARREVASCS